MLRVPPALLRKLLTLAALVNVLPAQSTALNVFGDGRSGSTLHFGVTTQDNSTAWVSCAVLVALSQPPVPVSFQGVPILVDPVTTLLVTESYQQYRTSNNPPPPTYKWSLELPVPVIGVPFTLEAQAVAIVAGFASVDVTNGVTVALGVPTTPERVIVTHYSGSTLVVQRVEPATGNSIVVGSYGTCAGPYGESRRPSVSADGRYVTFSCPYGVGGMAVNVVDTTTGSSFGVPQYGDPNTTVGMSVGLFHPDDSDIVWTLNFTGVPCFVNRLNYTLAGYSISRNAYVQAFPVLTNPNNCNLPGYYMRPEWTFTADGNYAVFRIQSDPSGRAAPSLVVVRVVRTPGQPLSFAATPDIVLPVAAPTFAYFTEHEAWPVPSTSIVLAMVVNPSGNNDIGVFAVDVQDGPGRAVSQMQTTLAVPRYQDFAADGSWGLLYEDFQTPPNWWIFQSANLAHGQPFPIVSIPNPMPHRPNGTVALTDRSLLAYSGGSVPLYRIRFDANWNVAATELTSREIDPNFFVRIHKTYGNPFGSVGLDTAVTVFDERAILVVRDFPVLIDPQTMTFHSVVPRGQSTPLGTPVPPAGWIYGNTSVHR